MDEKETDETTFTPEEKEAVVNYNLSYFGIEMLRAMNDTVVTYGQMLDKGEATDALTANILEACLVTFAHVREVIDIIGQPLIKPMEESGWSYEDQLKVRELILTDPRIERLDILVHEDTEGYKERWAKEQGEKLMSGLVNLLKGTGNGPSTN